MKTKINKLALMILFANVIVIVTLFFSHKSVATENQGNCVTCYSTTTPWKQGGTHWLIYECGSCKQIDVLDYRDVGSCNYKTTPPASR